MAPTRREFLTAASAFAATFGVRRSFADELSHPVEPPEALTFKMMEFEHTPMYGGQSLAVAAVPKGLRPDERLPLVVLLPGGHHNMQGFRTGVWGWWSEYMLGDTDTAMRRGNLGPKNWADLGRPEEIAEVNRLLVQKPYRGLVFVTPWVVGRQLDPAPHGTMVADFLRIVVARARAELPVIPARDATGLGGMSSGGLWAIYSGSLCSDLFGTLVATQPYTEDLVPPLRAIVNARKQPQRLRMISSVDDHQKKTTLALSNALHGDGIDHEYYEYKGAHSAEFAFGPGGIDALLQFDRRLRGEELDGSRPLPDRDGLAGDLALGDDRARAPFEPPVETKAPQGLLTGVAIGAAAASVVATVAVGTRLRSRGSETKSPRIPGPHAIATPVITPVIPPVITPVTTPVTSNGVDLELDIEVAGEE